MKNPRSVNPKARDENSVLSYLVKEKMRYKTQKQIRRFHTIFKQLPLVRKRCDIKNKNKHGDFTRYSNKAFFPLKKGHEMVIYITGF
jgi:hypothetical protein